ncbi:hypothetical protein FPH17_05345 [Corynebacterium godavarianum]|uniref:DMT family transporter n=1 Tax=Corynebacterium godavarianum TaxID=2054421 RepID=A0ABY3E5G5_9CORY|nr:DMT family transporter [Corynebacterium godavarianum]MBL7284915.1 hypothetical protein [Corynebacterium godavarianum]TSJ74877.1 hypothetical protein FPH17_05345 [Corynebacterium godavarianum]
MHNNYLAVGFAFTSALLIAVGTVWRHQILRAGRDQGEVNDSPLSALKRPAWWFSLALALAAYGFQAVALAFGSLLVVQPVLVLSLMLTLLLSARVERRRMSAATSFWAILLTVFVGVVVVVGRPLPGERAPHTWEWLTAVGIGLVGLFSTFAFARAHSAAVQSLAFGILCGAIFGYLAVFSKVAVDAYVHGGVLGILTSWQFWAMLACAVIGTVVQQFAFGAGKLATTLPAMKVVEPLVALTLGLVLLGEKFSLSGALGWTAMALLIAGMLFSAAMVTRVSIR